MLPETLNGHSVSMENEDLGTYMIIWGEFVEIGGHNDYLTVSSNITWNATVQAYAANVTVTWEPLPGTPTVHLGEIGIRLPEGFNYITASASLYPDNLVLGEPTITTDTNGAELLRWTLGNPAPSVSSEEPQRYQAFHASGSGEATGEYSWVVANRVDIGTIGEVSGDIYRVGANATHVGSGASSARVRADLIETPDAVYVVSWSLER